MIVIIESATPDTPSERSHNPPIISKLTIVHIVKSNGVFTLFTTGVQKNKSC